MDGDEYLRQIDELVRRHGVAIQYVGAGDDEPQFGYTVGLFWCRTRSSYSSGSRPT